jgi:hypothetical protein
MLDKLFVAGTLNSINVRIPINVFTNKPLNIIRSTTKRFINRFETTKVGQ